MTGLPEREQAVGTVTSDEAAPSGPPRRVVLLVRYEGGAFHGFAAQPGQVTVQGRLEAALARLAGAAVATRCAGRTDTGVHATTQVVHADLPIAALERARALRRPAEGAPAPIELCAFEELPGLARSLTHQIGPGAGVWRAFVAPEGFDARHSAIRRRYRYVIERDPRQDPLYAAGAAYVEGALDLAAMRIACDPLVGEHDFSAFCRHPKDRPRTPLMRRVYEAGLREEGSRLLFEIEGNAFCHQMVRSIVGLLIEIGLGRRSPQEMHARLLEPTREGGARPAPAHGLCLVAVEYPEPLGGRIT